MDIHSHRSISNSPTKCILLFALVLPLLSQAQSIPPDAKSPDVASTNQFAADVTEFLGKELTAHLADVRTLDPPQERVVGALTAGKVSWGTFLRPPASYPPLTTHPPLPARHV